MRNTTRITVASIFFSIYAFSNQSLAALDTAWEYKEIYNPVAETRTYIANIEFAASEIELRCSANDRKTELRLRLPVGANHTSDLQVQFDNSRPKRMAWQPSISGYSLSLPWEQVDTFSRQLSAYNNIQVKMSSTGDAPAAYTIPLKRSSQAIANLREQCRFE